MTFRFSLSLSRKYSSKNLSDQYRTEEWVEGVPDQHNPNPGRHDRNRGQDPKRKKHQSDSDDHRDSSGHEIEKSHSSISLKQDDDDAVFD